jgi:hypothetical protein
MVKLLALLLYIQQSVVHIFAKRLAILAYVVHDFPQTILLNAGVLNVH